MFCPSNGKKFMMGVHHMMRVHHMYVGYSLGCPHCNHNLKLKSAGGFLFIGLVGLVGMLGLVGLVGLLH